ncbi:YjfI family protein [Rudaea cellulosilytica]|uniref:YjfI family protein n=1 Tax=Rudaea cellulosilytica TaxID=540746 RepID=UPI000377F788|nr:YjfI family protein [Rudaea cellulosilytica]
MPDKSASKSRSAVSRRQQAFRERMKAKGLVARQVYIRAEHVPVLMQLELSLREATLSQPLVTIKDYAAMTHPWTTQTLFDALETHVARERLPLRLRLEAGAEPTIAISLPEHGDLDIHLAASGQQLFVSTPLCLGSQVHDRGAFNDACLRLNPINPLSNIGLQTLDGEDVYTVFGELSTRSPIANIVEEVITLADNTLQAAHALQGYIHRA